MASQTQDSRQIVLIIALFYLALATTFLVYWPGLSGPFILDDYPQLQPIIAGLDVANWTTTWRDYVLSESGPLMRPVAMLTFIFNAVSSGGDIWLWKYTNLLIHLLAGVMVFLVTSKIADAEDYKNKYIVALTVAALWLLHPLQVSTVLYTVQRMELLSALFVLTGLLCYSSGRQRQLTGRPRGGLLIAAAFIVFFPLAAFSKESGLLFPLFALLIESFFFHFQGSKGAKILLLGLFTLFLLLPGLVAFSIFAFRFDGLILRGYEARNFTLPERAFTELRVLAYYLYQILVPMQGNLGFYHDDLIVSKSLLEPQSGLISLILLGGLLALAWYLRRKNRLASFGILFFFSAHLLESTIFPLELMFEHRNYLALYGALLAVMGLAGLPTAISKLKAVMAAAAISMVTVVTMLYVDTWSSVEKMQIGMYAAHPHSPRLHADIASYYTESGQYDKARQFLADFTGPGFDLQRTYILCRERQSVSDTELRKIRFLPESKITNYEVQGFIELANLGLDKKCTFSAEKFIAILDESLKTSAINPINASELLLYKAHYLHEMGRLDAALAALEDSYRAYSRTPIPLFLAAEWLIEASQNQKAEVYLERAIVTANADHQNYSEFITRIRHKLANN